MALLFMPLEHIETVYSVNIFNTLSNYIHFALCKSNVRFHATILNLSSISAHKKPVGVKCFLASVLISCLGGSTHQHIDNAVLRAFPL